MPSRSPESFKMYQIRFLSTADDEIGYEDQRTGSLPEIVDYAISQYPAFPKYHAVYRAIRSVGAFVVLCKTVKGKLLVALIKPKKS